MAPRYGREERLCQDWMVVVGEEIMQVWSSDWRWERMVGEERMWNVAVVSVKAVVSNPAARSITVVSWRT